MKHFWIKFAQHEFRLIKYSKNETNFSKDLQEKFQFIRNLTKSSKSTAILSFSLALALR